MDEASFAGGEYLIVKCDNAKMWELLEAKGQKVALKEAMGSTQSIMVGPDGELYGASDPRSVDDLTAGY